MTILKQLPLLILMLTLGCCGTTMDKAYSKETVSQDLVELKKKLTSEEIDMITGIIAIKEFKGENLLGKTYNDLLEEAKQLQAEVEKKKAEEERLAAEARKAEKERIERLGNSLTVALFEKGYYEYQYQEYISYKFAFENKTDKDIRAFKGSIVINDLFDAEVKRFNMTYDEGVKANSKTNYSATTDYNKYINEDVVLKSKDLEDLKITWIPEKIIFTDGTTLE